MTHCNLFEILQYCTFKHCKIAILHHWLIAIFWDLTILYKHLKIAILQHLNIAKLQYCNIDSLHVFETMQYCTLKHCKIATLTQLNFFETAILCIQILQNCNIATLQQWLTHCIFFETLQHYTFKHCKIAILQQWLIAPFLRHCKIIILQHCNIDALHLCWDIAILHI